MEGAIVSEQEIRDWCRMTLSELKVPDLVRFFDEFPRTGDGKVADRLRKIRGRVEFDSRPVEDIFADQVEVGPPPDDWLTPIATEVWV